MKPLEGNVILQRIEPSEASGMIHLPDTQRYKIHFGKVLSVSGKAEFTEGDCVVFNPLDIKWIEKWSAVTRREIVTCPIESVLAKVENPENLKEIHPEWRERFRKCER